VTRSEPRQHPLCGITVAGRRLSSWIRQAGRAILLKKRGKGEGRAERRKWVKDSPAHHLNKDGSVAILCALIP